MGTTQQGWSGRQTKGKGSPAMQQKSGTNREASSVKQQRSTSPNALLFWAIASLIVAVIAAGVVIKFTLSEMARGGDISGVMVYSNLSRNHVSGTVTYQQNPPVGGDHNPVWQNCGIYSAPLANEHTVHSMEHGAVWITYQLSLAESGVKQLRSLARGHRYVLLSPYPGLPSPVVISAWGVQLQVKSASDPRLAQFLSKYEQGPQTPEPGAPCSGGLGTPDEQ